MQFHVEVLALPFVDAASAILCAACLAPAHLSCSWCQFLLWVSFGPWGVSSICCCVLFCFCCCFCWRAADAISCGGACSGRSRCCFCNSMCCLPCSCAFKLQLVPGSCFGFGAGRGVWAASAVASAVLAAVFSVKGCWCNFMWRCLLCHLWMLLLQFYVLLVLLLRI